MRFEDFTVAKIKIVALAILLQIVVLMITSVSEGSTTVFFFTAENVDNRFCQMFIDIWETQRNLNIPIKIFEK
jgi:hypothetical protein